VFERRLRAELSGFDLANRGLLVAVSGGIDSVTLATALGRLAQPLGIALSLGHVNHGLRGAESDEDEAFVEELARRLAVPFALERVTPDGLRGEGPSRTRPTLQEAARRERYAALERMRRQRGAHAIATAHNADDQAETVLMRVLRGCGPAGLAGIPARSPDGRIVRPLLALTRSEIEAYARDAGVRWREDSSNSSDLYTRNRLRHHWLPALSREFNPQLLRTLVNLAEAAEEDEEWMAQAAAREAALCLDRGPGGILRLRRDAWSARPEALSRRIVRQALIDVGIGRELTRTHLERVLAFVGARGTAAEPGKQIELPCGVRLRATATHFELGPATAANRAAC
jgi:tRNA(Ile)-lysidine synthase